MQVQVLYLQSEEEVSQDALSNEQFGNLDDEAASVLDYERDWRRRFGSVGPIGKKESEVMDKFGWTHARYSQVLHRALKEPNALTHNGGEFALMVNQMNELARIRHEARTGRRSET